jgi:hypothetical protein
VPVEPHRDEHQNPDRHDPKDDEAAHELLTAGSLAGHHGGIRRNAEAASCDACSRFVTVDRSDGCDEHIGGVSAYQHECPASPARLRPT